MVFTNIGGWDPHDAHFPTCVWPVQTLGEGGPPLVSSLPARATPLDSAQRSQILGTGNGNQYQTRTKEIPTCKHMSNPRV